MKRIIRPKPDGLKVFVDGVEITDGVEYVEIDSQPTIPPHSLAASASARESRVGPSTEDPAYREHAEILAQALRLYGERNEMYKDNWRRFGWRGCLFRVRERAERMWDALWDLPMEHRAGPKARAAEDDAIDLINFAVFTIRAIRSGDRDGSWW